MSSYTIDKTLSGVSFEQAVEQTRAALAGKGFGVLTEIDVKATMKKKLDADIDDYLILGACNPQMAHQAIGLEPRLGAMLPCNVILRRTGPDTVEVSAIDPVASMAAIENDKLHAVAGQVRTMLADVVDAI
ncbi:MAG: DUF302 domain-containing protein [Burkholderiaceae bacterium]|nr:DUF302 domain-containing protein [Burkholderiaceae bacterium]